MSRPLRDGSLGAEREMEVGNEGELKS
jgi:hypothetical protein